MSSLICAQPLQSTLGLACAQCPCAFVPHPGGLTIRFQAPDTQTIELGRIVGRCQRHGTFSKPGLGSTLVNQARLRDAPLRQLFIAFPHKAQRPLAILGCRWLGKRWWHHLVGGGPHDISSRRGRNH